jgi:hypothetical protein
LLKIGIGYTSEKDKRLYRIARLISKAPELLEALEGASRILGSETCNGCEGEDCDWRENIERYKRLIAEAKGEQR